MNCCCCCLCIYLFGLSQATSDNYGISSLLLPKYTHIWLIMCFVNCRLRHLIVYLQVQIVNSPQGGAVSGTRGDVRRSPPTA